MHWIKLSSSDHHPDQFVTVMAQLDRVDGDLKVQANGLDTYGAAISPKIGNKNSF